MSENSHDNNQHTQPTKPEQKTEPDKVVQMAEAGKEIQDKVALIKKQEESSNINKITGKPTFLTINKGKQDEYTLEVVFPGVRRASRLRDDARNGFNAIVQSDFMDMAIKNLIVQPKIYSLDWFDNHGGYDDAFGQILDWFQSSINGDTYSPAD